MCVWDCVEISDYFGEVGRRMRAWGQINQQLPTHTHTHTHTARHSRYITHISVYNLHNIWLLAGNAMRLTNK